MEGAKEASFCATLTSRVEIIHAKKFFIWWTENANKGVFFYLCLKLVAGRPKCSHFFLDKLAENLATLSLVMHQGGGGNEWSMFFAGICN